MSKTRNILAGFVHTCVTSMLMALRLTITAIRAYAICG